MKLMHHNWKNKQRDIDVTQYVYYINAYHYNWHKAIELIIVLRGNIEVSIDNQHYILEEDDVILINPNVGHATLAKTPESVAMLIHLDPIYFQSYYPNYRLLHFTCISNSKTREDMRFNKLRELSVDMMKAIDAETPPENIYFESLLHQLATTLVIYFSPKEMSSTDIAGHKEKTEVVKEIIEFIDENYKQRITLDDLSKVSGYHKSYISQIVKEQLGINYYDYLTRVRLREATYALANLDDKIADIALTHGFSEVKAFNTTFKKSFGKTPSEYRGYLTTGKVSINMLKEKTYLTEKEYNEILKQKQKDNLPNYDSPEVIEKETLVNQNSQYIKEIEKALHDSLLKIKKIQ